METNCKVPWHPQTILDSLRTSCEGRFVLIGQNVGQKRRIRVFRPVPALVASGCNLGILCPKVTSFPGRSVASTLLPAPSTVQGQILYPLNTAACLITVTRTANIGWGAGLVGHSHYALLIVTGYYAVVLVYSCLVQGWGESGGY